MVNFDRVVFSKEAEEFVEELDTKVRNKVYYNIRKAQFVKNSELFKKLDGEIWEFRTIYRRARIRLFAFRDRDDKTETIVIATNGIIKQTSKVPKREINKAKQIRKKYFATKNSEK